MPAKKKEQKQVLSKNIDFQNLVKTLSKNKDHEDAHLIKDLGDAPFWLSTGDDILDLYISNRKHGGIPGGRITEISGLPGCVTEDTQVKIKCDSKEKIVKIEQIKQLLEGGKQVFIESYYGQFQLVTKYIQKGILPTYKITLQNSYTIKVSSQHKFFEKTLGWISCKDLILNQSELLCQGNIYHKVIKKEYIANHKIVDITVPKTECYYGNGILNHNSGKSLVCSHLIKSCQDMGGIPVLIQTQAATSLPFLQAIGVDLSKVIHYRLKTVEKIHKVTEQLMYSVKLQMPDVPMLIIVDSLTAATTQAQLKNTDYENKGYNAALKARMNSQAFSKLTMMAAQQKVALVYTTQLRANMNMANPYMDPYETSSGGMALPFYSSIRIRLHRSSKLKQNIHGVPTVVGSTIRARIDKSRLGATFRQCTFDVYYDCGINNYTNWLATLKAYKAIDGRGTANLPWIVKHQGKQINLGKDFYKQIRSNPEIREKVYDIIADLLILKYKKVQDTDNRQIISEPDQGMTVDQ